MSIITKEHKAAVAKACGIAGRTLQKADLAAMSGDPVQRNLFAQEALTLRAAMSRATEGSLAGERAGILAIQEAAAETERVLKLWGL